MALQCMPLFFSEAVEVRRAKGLDPDDYLILVATSGDTGKAALEGFADRAHTSIVVFYPADGVSDIQRLQMVTQHGANVGVFGVRGNFDDCQSAVKAAFSDESFAEELHAEHGLRLSSANSINWGRLLPQIVYYVSAYADMVASGGVIAGEPMDVCVPTGNFGNILGAYYARRIGVPIERLLCASNENNVLTDFINTGVYDIAQRRFVTTPSPSMDILISSNLERQLYELSRSHEQRARLDERSERHGTVPGRPRDLRRDALAVRGRLLLERRVARNHQARVGRGPATCSTRIPRSRGRSPSGCAPTIPCWSSRPRIGRSSAQTSTRRCAVCDYAEPLPADAAAALGVGLLAKVQELAPSGACVPRALAELEEREVRFSDGRRAPAETASKTRRAGLAARHRPARYESLRRPCRAGFLVLALGRDEARPLKAPVRADAHETGALEEAREHVRGYPHLLRRALG